jgi:hypothetical protein
MLRLTGVLVIQAPLQILFEAYSFLHTIQTGSGIHPASYSIGTQDSVSRGKPVAA